MKRSLNYITTVSNDDSGWTLIEDIQRVSGKSKIRLRGRSKNRRHIMKLLGRHYNPYCANANDINQGDLNVLRKLNTADNLSIAIYFR